MSSLLITYDCSDSYVNIDTVLVCSYKKHLIVLLIHIP